MSEITIRLYNSMAKTGQSSSYFDLDVDHMSTSIKADMSTIQNDGIGEIFSLGSQEFTLPSTPTNDEFFQYTFDIGSDEKGLTFKKKFKSQILLDGGIAADGYLYYNGTTTTKDGKTTYKCTFNDSVPALGDLLKDVSLGDLNWENYDHAYNISNITSSWEGDLFNGDIIYPNIFYGYGEGQTNYNYTLSGDNSIFDNGSLPYTDFKPAIRVGAILDKIFNSIGYEYSSSFFSSNTGSFGLEGVSTEDLYFLTTPSDQKGIIDETPQYAEAQSTSLTTFSQGTVISPAQGQSFPGSSGSWADILHLLNEDTNPTSFDINTGIYTVPANGDYAFSNGFSLRNISAYFVGRQVYSYYMKNGIYIGSTYQNNTLPAFGASTFINHSVILPNLVAGDEIEFFIEVDSNLDDVECEFANLQIINQLPVPDATYLELQLTDVKILDFIKGLQEQFNLIIWADKDDPRTIKIEPYNTWVNSGRVLDWSDKVDYLKGIEISHPSSDAEREILFKNKEDDDDSMLEYYGTVYDNGLGAYLYESDSDYSDGDKEIGGKIFAPTVMSPIKNSSTDPSTTMVIPHISNKDDDGVERPIKFKPRLLFNNGIKHITGSDNLPNNYSIIDEVGNEASLNHYSQFSPLTKMEEGNDKFDLNFAGQGYWWHTDAMTGYGHWTDKTAFNWFWSSWINNIYRNPARKVTLNIKFDPTDIFDFNINDTVFIDGQEYLINKISGFNFLKPQSTKVELIKKLESTRRAPIFTIGGGNDPVSPNGDTPVGDDEYNGGEVVFEEAEDGIVRPLDNDDTSVVIDSAKIPTRLINRQGYQRDSSGDIKSQISKGKSSLPNTTPFESSFGVEDRQSSNIIRSITDSIQVKGIDNIVNSNSSKINIYGDNNTSEAGVNSSLIIGDDNTVRNQNEQVTIIASDSVVDSSNKNIMNFGADNSTISGSNNSDISLIGLNSISPNPATGQTTPIIQGNNNEGLFFVNNSETYISNNSYNKVSLINNSTLELTADISSSSQNTLINNKDTNISGSGFIWTNNLIANNVDSDLNFEMSGSSSLQYNTILGNDGLELDIETPWTNNSITNNLQTDVWSDSINTGSTIKLCNISLNDNTNIQTVDYVYGSVFEGNNKTNIYISGSTNSQFRHNVDSTIGGVYVYSVIENNHTTIAEDHTNALVMNNLYCDLVAGQSSTKQTSYINNLGLSGSSTVSGSFFINNRKDDSKAPSNTFGFSVGHGSTYINHTHTSNPDSYDNIYNSSSEQYGSSVVLGKTWNLGAEYDGYNVVSLDVNETHSIDDTDKVIIVNHNQNVASGYIYVELPDISASSHDGRVITIKTNDTISASHRFQILAQSGQTIDGSVSQLYTTPYSLVKVMAVNGEWFIVG